MREKLAVMLQIPRLIEDLSAGIDDRIRNRMAIYQRRNRRQKGL